MSLFRSVTQGGTQKEALIPRLESRASERTESRCTKGRKHHRNQARGGKPELGLPNCLEAQCGKSGSEKHQGDPVIREPHNTMRCTSRSSAKGAQQTLEKNPPESLAGREVKEWL